MPKWFYAAWALAVLLALAIPMAIPFLIWPDRDPQPGDWVGPPDEEMFGRYAMVAIEGTRYYPKTVSVESGPLLSSPVPCGGPAALHSSPRRYTAIVTLRGPYGLPLSEYEVTCDGWSRADSLGGGGLYAGLALLGGAGAVSLPFYLWLRHTRNRRLQLAQ